VNVNLSEKSTSQIELDIRMHQILFWLKIGIGLAQTFEVRKINIKRVIEEKE